MAQVIETQQSHTPKGSLELEEQDVFDDELATGEDIVGEEEIEQEPIDPSQLAELPLQNNWKFYYINGDHQHKEWNADRIEIARITTVDYFWAVINRSQLPHKLKVKHDYMFFKEGILPEWEDPANKGGGLWKIIIPNKMRHDHLDRLWYELLLSLIGEIYEDLSDDICGAYLQRRQKEDRIQLWIRPTARDNILQIGRTLKEKLGLSENSPIDFFPHNEAFKSGSRRREMFRI